MPKRKDEAPTSAKKKAKPDKDVDEKPEPKKQAKSKKETAPTGPYEDALGWTVVPPSLFYRDWNTQPSKAIAAFDLDGTLVNVKSGAQFPRSADDWKWYNKKVAQVLKDYSDKGFKVVIFSNQGGVKSALNGAAATKVKERIQQIVDKAQIPILAFCATLEDDNRKPATGMWKYFVENCNGGVIPDLKKSFFVGDAAGRPGDFADTDKLFAKNIGITFKIPEDEFGEMEGKRAIQPLPASTTSENEELVSLFKKLAEKYFTAGEKFKGSAFNKAATALASFPMKITSSNTKEVGKLPGIGKASLGLINEYLTTGAIELLKEEDGAPAASGGGGGSAPTAHASSAAAMKFM